MQNNLPPIANNEEEAEIAQIQTLLNNQNAVSAVKNVENLFQKLDVC